MIVIENEQLVMVDVDDTLIMWGDIEEGDASVVVYDPYDGRPSKFRIHEGHIKVLKDRKTRGAHVTVWSSGGYKWAEAVVEALKLKDYVDVVSSKPFMYIDDKEASDILGERLYLGSRSNYGKINNNVSLADTKETK
jgi:hypothetical protein